MGRLSTGLCGRCQSPFGRGRTCKECGAGADRTARRIRRRNPIGGKRGRNSGVVSQHGKTG